MNKLIRTLIALAAFGAGTTALLAQPAVKLVVVDMAKTYDTYYKSEDGVAKLRNAELKAQEQVEEMKKQGQSLVDEYKELMEQSKNTVLTVEARSKAEQEAQKKGEEIQRKQNEIQTFVTETQRRLQTTMKNQRELFLEEISKVVVEIAKRKGATLVIDKSGPSVYQIPVVLYSDPAYDITDEVVLEVNKDRPAAPVTPAAAAPAITDPSTPAAPAPFTVPNVGPKPEAKKP